MKFMCLGYYDEATWETMPESAQQALIDECFAYDDELRKNGHFAGGEALETARNATTLRVQDGKVSFTDGPFAETKEQIGGVLILEARDREEAHRLMAGHPGLRFGPFEVRAIEDMSDMVRESAERRARARA